ncbi:hypothetical protein OENI_950004 [Oenococcus oeni]|nr:hypothetical protein OENI_950004 [Oenococcus oeni]
MVKAPLLISGTTGSGKSTLIAYYVALAKQYHWRGFTSWIQKNQIFL